MKKQIIYCNCRGEFAQEQLMKETQIEFDNQSITGYELSDLCGLAAKNRKPLQEMFSAEMESLVIACHPRTVDRLLQYAEIDTSKLKLQFLNYREHSSSEIKEGIKTFTEGTSEEGKLTKLNGPEDWPSWYPVVDYDRCTACGQCADFCLFGVYTKSEDRVEVTNPSGCKNNCPACARICPHTAIIFPKYQQGGAISGSTDYDELEEQKRQKQDVDDILGSDIYKALEGRKKRRKSIIKKTAMEKALAEREDFLKKDQN